jgi:predicted MPP superfamily phosphohydrolase
MLSSITSDRMTRREMLQAVVGAGVGAATGILTHGFMYERHRIDVTRTTLSLSGWPPALAGLRVGFLTDLHRSATVPHSLIDDAVRLLLAEKPDLILLGGDYVSFADRQYIQPVAEALAPLAAPHGVFGVLGNHDDDRDVPAALEQQGVEVLRDERTRLTVHGEVLDLIGIRYWTRRMADIARAARGAAPASILMAHTPSRLTEASALAVPLMLSGHTHGGQVVLPVLGAVAARGFPVIAGEGRQNVTTAFVSRGIGTVYIPIRISCPPEVAVLTLRRSELA